MAGSGAMVLFLMTAISVVSTSLHDAQHANGGDVRIGRYQTITPLARGDQQDVLSAIVDIELGDEIKTLKEAIVAVLESNDYRLSPNPAVPCQEKWFQLLLPAGHRELGPLTLRQALEALSGPACRPAVDSLQRLIYFERVLPVERNVTPDCDCD